MSDNLDSFTSRSVEDTDNVVGYRTAATGGEGRWTFAAIKTWIKAWLVKGDVGLGNVDNTADASKPISTAQQAALDLKAPVASPTFTGTPAVPTATPGTNTTQVASTAFVAAAVADGALGLTIGEDVQAWDTELDELAAKTIPSSSVVGGVPTAHMPRLAAAMRTAIRTPQTPTTINFVVFGSSVGNGAGLTAPKDTGDYAPGNYFVGQLNTYLNRLGQYNFVTYNRSVNGSTVYNTMTPETGALALWEAEVAATPSKAATVAILVFPMNDGMTAQYNSGATYNGGSGIAPPGFTFNFPALVDRLQALGMDVVIMTSPHPHTTRTTWSMPSGVPMTWPSSVSAPVPDASLVPTVSASTLSITYQGASFPISYRHFIENEFMRQTGVRKSCTIVDAEHYMFGYYKNGGTQEDTFGLGEWAHFNNLGYEVSYWKSAEDIAKGMGDSPIFNAGVSGHTLLDIVSTTRGAIAFRGASDWAALAPGTATRALLSQGPGADPAYGPIANSVAGRTGAVVLAQADIAGLTTADAPTFGGITSNGDIVSQGPGNQVVIHDRTGAVHATHYADGGYINIYYLANRFRVHLPTGNTTSGGSHRIGGDSGPTWSSGTGAPSASEPNGSLYSRTDGTGPNLYVRENGAWVAK